MTSASTVDQRPIGMGAPTSAAALGAEPRTASVGTIALAGATVGIAVVVLALTGDPVVAALPCVLIALIYATARLAVRGPLIAILALTIASDVTSQGVPGDPAAVWRSFVFPLEWLLTEPLSKVVHIEALKLMGIELILLVLIGIAALRRAAGDTTDTRGGVPPARALMLACGIALAGILAIEVWGLARGGADAKMSLWQIRELIWMPILTWFLCRTLRDARDAMRLGVAMTAVGCVKVLIGAYYLFVIASPAGERPQTVTSHADSVLWVAILAGWAGAAYYRPTAKRVACSAVVVAWMLFGLIINNRRTAFVSLLACGAVFVALLPLAARRRLLRGSLWAAPFLGAYLLVAQHSTSSLFAPGRQLVSVSQQKDGSSQMRDIENYNLIATLKPHMLLGTGWGHEYTELSRAYDIAKVFPQYRYMAHNSVLWLLSVSGVVGFTAIWLPIVVGVMLATRSHRLARVPLERTVAFSALSVTTAFAVQAWSDMGTQGWTGEILLAAGLAATAQLATVTGAWPQGTRILGWSPPRATGDV